MKQFNIVEGLHLPDIYKILKKNLDSGYGYEYNKNETVHIVMIRRY